MGEVWIAAVVTVGGGIISGMGAEKKDKADKKFQSAEEKENDLREGRLGAQATGYEMALEDFYNQKDRFEKQRGLDQFRQFSTVGNYNPAAADDSATRLAAPVTPQYNQFATDAGGEVIAQPPQGTN